MIANQRTQGSFSFSFLTANAPQRLSLCLERVFTPASLLNITDSSTPLLFFLLRLRQLTDLRFSLFFLSLFYINARVLPPNKLSVDKSAHFNHRSPSSH